MATKINKIIVTLFLVLLPCVSIAEVLVAGLSCDAIEASTEPQKHYLMLYKTTSNQTGYSKMCLDQLSSALTYAWNCRTLPSTLVNEITSNIAYGQPLWFLHRKTLKFSNPETYQCQLGADPAAMKARVEGLKAKQLEGNQL